MRKFVIIITVLMAFVWFLNIGMAHAARLEVSSDAAVWVHLSAAILLYLHIGGGAVGLAAGTAAGLSRKGAKVHRIAGKIFLVSMLITYAIGTGVAPFLNENQRPNFVAGVLALYLLITGVLAAKRRDFRAGKTEYIGLFTALTITGLGVLFMYMGAKSESGTVDGSPPEAFLLFIVAGSLSAIGDLKVIIQRRISNAARITRHLWRMCFSFFIASASLFLGQPQVFTEEFNASIWPALLAFAPILLMMIYFVKIRFGSLFTRKLA